MKNRSDFSLYGIFVGETGGIVKRKMSESGWTFPALLDTRSAAAVAYGIPGYPATFLIDKKGNIAAIAIGSRKWDEETASSLIGELFSE